MGVNQILLVRVQSLQKRRGEAAGGSESGAGGNIGHACDFQISSADV